MRAHRRNLLLEALGGLSALAWCALLTEHAAACLEYVTAELASSQRRASHVADATRTEPRNAGPESSEIGGAGTPDLPREAARVASYSLKAVLDTAASTVRGSGVIEWRNASTVPVTELWFHLYLNAFKSEQTLFLRSPYGASRSGTRARAPGHIHVQRLAARELGGRNLWALADKHSPGDPNDQTDIRVPLPSPIAPGQTLTLDIEFSAKLPEIVERTGYRNDFYFVAQWFPKLAKLEANGAWAHFPFHAQSEFYADFGDYRVQVDVPENLVVGAAGQCVRDQASNGRRVLEFEAKSVHDFAWTAWHHFREHTAQVGGVDVRILYPPGFEQSRDRTFEILRFALPHYDRILGRYPYPTLTVVHPPQFARASGGMEYPTLITTGGAWYLPLSGIRALESVVVHELGHQWFYGIIASNEHAAPFLDEGLNSYMELGALEAAYGQRSAVALPGLSVSVESIYRAWSLPRAQDDIVASAAIQFENFATLGALVYGRTALILRTLANVYGQDALARAIGAYARRYRFQHPTAWNFLDVLREELGEQAHDVLKRALFERASVDFFVRDVASTRVTKNGTETWIGRVAVHRSGSLELPVDVDLIAANGTRQRRHWRGIGTWAAFDYAGPSKLIGAVVDPERRILLDDNLFNNATSTVSSYTPRVLERAAYWFELLILGLGA